MWHTIKISIKVGQLVFLRHGCIISFPLQTLSDEAAKVMYQMKRASSVRNINSNATDIQKKTMRKKKKAIMEGM